MSSQRKVALPKVDVFEAISSGRRERVRADGYLNEIESLLGSEEPLFITTAKIDALHHKRFFFVFFVVCILGIALPSLIGPESRVPLLGGPNELAATRASRPARQTAQDAGRGDVMEGRSTAERMSPARNGRPDDSRPTR